MLWGISEMLRYTPHNLSDEVTKIRCEMDYPDSVSDIPPKTCQMKWQRWDVIWNTQKGCQIYPPSVNIEFSELAILAPLKTY